jgi:translation initiation factor 4B
MALGDFLANQSLGSWADEMDSQPLPSATSSYSRDRGDGERRAFTQPSWENARASGGSMGGGMADRGASYGECTCQIL